MARTIFSSFTAKGKIQIDQDKQDSDSGEISLQMSKFDISKIEIYRGDVSKYNATYFGQVDQAFVAPPNEEDDDDFDDEDE